MRSYVLVPIVTLLLIVSLGLLAFLPQYGWALVDPPTAGQFGDLVGGFFGPILSLVGIAFVVITLREQRAGTNAAREGEVIEAFQNKYYQLVRMHRQNVAEMQVGSGDEIKEGRRVFVAILNELQLALKIVRRAVALCDPTMPPLDQMQIAYYVIFFGIGDNSSPQMREALKAAGSRLSSTQFDFIESELKANRKLTSYEYFAGHQSRLGHYYRHLYQTISYVDAQAIEKEKKYEYTKTVRAQLSTHEQALLLVNSLTPIGWRWWSEGFLIDYKMVKNIPKGFLEEYCSFVPSELISDGHYFEWQDINEKPKELGKLTFIDD